jgi:hypothetical protein
MASVNGYLNRVNVVQGMAQRGWMSRGAKFVVNAIIQRLTAAGNYYQSWSWRHKRGGDIPRSQGSHLINAGTART